MPRKLLLALALVLFSLVAFSAAAHAQSPYLSTGSWSNPVGPLSSCPSGFDTPGMTCYTTTVSCPDPYNPGHNIADLGVTYGYEAPPTGTPYIGTIVMFPGGPGTSPATAINEIQFIQHYKGLGYEMIQLSWDEAWEDVNFPIPPDTFGNIQTAACRQATFLSFVHSSTTISSQTPVILWQPGPTAGFCAQGSSAGSAAIAYAMTWYGAADATTGFLDNVELLAGPPLSRVDAGCFQSPSGPWPNVDVCDPSNGGIGACQGWPSPHGISLSPTYQFPAYNGVRQWTNVAACAETSGDTSPWNGVWDNMSIVSPTVTTQQKTYPKTSVGAWLCDTSTGAMNNTTPEGYLYYQAISPLSTAFTVNAIYNCDGPEGVANGYDIPNTQDPKHEGITLIEKDMQNRCIARHQ